MTNMNKGSKRLIAFRTFAASPPGRLRRWTGSHRRGSGGGARGFSIPAEALESARAPAASNLAARRTKTWDIGAMAGDPARTPQLSPGFLPPGNGRATIRQDGEVVLEVRRTQHKATRKDSLTRLRLAASPWRWSHRLPPVISATAPCHQPTRPRFSS